MGFWIATADDFQVNAGGLGGERIAGEGRKSSTLLPEMPISTKRKMDWTIRQAGASTLVSTNGGLMI